MFTLKSLIFTLDQVATASFCNYTDDADNPQLPPPYILHHQAIRTQNEINVYLWQSISLSFGLSSAQHKTHGVTPNSRMNLPLVEQDLVKGNQQFQREIQTFRSQCQ